MLNERLSVCSVVFGEKWALTNSSVIYLYILTYSFSTTLLNDIRVMNDAGQKTVYCAIYKHLVDKVLNKLMK